MICNVVFVVFGGTLQRPFVVGVVSIPKPATLQNVPCLRENKGEVLGDFVLVFHRDICSQDSLIMARNYHTLKLRTRFQSPRARNYRKLGIPSPILGHDRTRLGSGLCAVVLRCLSRENVGR